MSRYDRPSHRVFMTFFLRSGWQVQFLEADLRTPLPRKLTFTDPDKIRELARRGEAWGDSESRQMLEHAIETGRGGVFLRLTPDQYARLDGSDELAGKKLAFESGTHSGAQITVEF
jgi:hypothetical protein